MTKARERPMKLAVIGLGMASKPHLAALRQLEGIVEVAGVTTRNSTHRDAVADRVGWPVIENVDAICARDDIDAALLITPPNARREIVGKLSAAGKAILMEKPVERNLAAATALVTQCEDRNVPLGIVFQHRFRTGALALRDLLHEGLLGQIHLVRVNLPWWRDQSYYDQAGRGSYAVDGGGVLITQAIHVLDLMLSLTGPVKSVSGQLGTTPLHRMEAEDVATASLLFQSGALGHVMATTASYPGGPETLELDCAEAAVKLTAGALDVYWRDGRHARIGDVTGSGGGSDPMDFPCDWHGALIADFAESWRDGCAPAVTGREALCVHALISAIEEANRTGCRTEVETLP